MNPDPSSLPTVVPASDDVTLTFFAIGAVINLVMIAAYFIWAYKQWHKSDGGNKDK